MATKRHKIIINQNPLRFCFYVLCLLVAIASSAFAQTSSSGSIKGRVVNESGQPLPNVRVVVRAVAAALTQEGATATTDREGKFEVNGLEPRSYQVSAWRTAYTLFNTGDDSWQKYYQSGDFVTLVMTKGGVITGTVTTQTGEPLVGVRVYAKLLPSAGSRLTFPFDRFTPERFTDDRGVYRIYGLPTGTYVVWAGGGSGNIQQLDAFDADVPTYAPASTRDTAMEIAVRAGTETNNVDIRYRGDEGRTVSGKASRSDGAQQAGFGITLTSITKNNANWTTLATQTPETKGFVFHGVDDGEYDVTAFSFLTPTGTDLAMVRKRIKISGADVTGLELVAQPLASVSGRVVLEESKVPECNGKPRPLLTEILFSAALQENSALVFHPQLRWLMQLSANADAQGNVSLKGLMPGRYSFVPEFAADYWYLQSVTLPATPPVRTLTDAAHNWTTLKSGDRLTGLTITVAQGAATLRGQVALKEGETSPDKSFVYLIPAEREKGDDVLRFFVAAVNPDGKVALNSIPPGRYWVLMKPGGDDTISSSAKLRSPDQADTRTRLRREAEAVKTELELKPCQNLIDFKVPLP